jgi:hypothetical protein
LRRYWFASVARKEPAPETIVQDLGRGQAFRGRPVQALGTTLVSFLPRPSSEILLRSRQRAHFSAEAAKTIVRFKHYGRENNELAEFSALPQVVLVPKVRKKGRPVRERTFPQ